MGHRRAGPSLIARPAAVRGLLAASRVPIRAGSSAAEPSIHDRTAVRNSAGSMDEARRAVRVPDRLLQVIGERRLRRA